MLIEPVAPVDVEILIVGADPVGLFGAYYAGLRGLRVAVMDSLPALGGQVRLLYPDKLVVVGGGLAAVRSQDVVTELVTRADKFAPVYLAGHKADTLVRLPDAENGAPGFVVTSDKGHRVRCGALVVTNGVGNFSPRQLPPVLEHPTRLQSYFAPDLLALAGKDVVIAGDGDSAVDWALRVQDVAASVTLVHRGEPRFAHGCNAEILEAMSVRTLTRSQIANVHGIDGVESIAVHNELTGEVSEVPCQELVMVVGSSPDMTSSLFWGIDIQDRRRIFVDDCMSTDVRGVFAAGDITQCPGRMRPLVTGFAEIATAVTNATGLIDPSGVVESIIQDARTASEHRRLRRKSAPS